MTKRFLSREEILGLTDLPVEEVEIPEWGGWVGVRAMTATERSQYMAALVEWSSDGIQQRPNIVNSDVRLAALTLVDPETGARLFTLDEVEALGQRSAVALNRIVERAQRLSALRPEDMELRVEGLGEVPSAGSTSS